MSESAIGTPFDCPVRQFRDEQTGRQVRQLTAGPGHCYPLYYFSPSFTPDGRFLVFHGERTGQVQLYRLDIAAGVACQLTDGATPDAGWAIWCERRLDGIYNHLSALNVARDEVVYFQDDEVRATRVGTQANRRIAKLPAGQMPIGQADCSPDGSLVAAIHTDSARYRAAVLEREARVAAGTFNWAKDHEAFRRGVGPVTLAAIDTATGAYRPVITTDFHFHHVVFADDRTLLLNHQRSGNGIWRVDIDGRACRDVRPPDAAGAHNARTCHQVVTANGVFYEANAREGTFLGRLDVADSSFTETRLPVTGYVHTGRDPAGRFAFIERAGSDGHELLSVHWPRDPQRIETRLIYRLRGPAAPGQRNHAHPALSPDRRSVVFTDTADDGTRQVFAVDVADLVARDEYW